MNLPKELILVIFKKDLAKLVCLNKEFNKTFKDLLKPLRLTPYFKGKIQSLYGYYEVYQNGDYKNSYEYGPYKVKTEDDIFDLGKKFNCVFSPVFYNGEFGHILSLANKRKTMIHKNIVLVYVASSTLWLSDEIISALDNYVIITNHDRTLSLVYTSSRVLTDMEKKMILL